MNREIKFRAWDKPSNKMFSHEALLAKYSGDRPKLVLDTYGDEVEYMQYTGLKDRNGVEIYEGDIVRRRTSDERMEQFAVKYRAPTFNIGDFDPSYGYTVIGNIYENADILN